MSYRLVTDPRSGEEVRIYNIEAYSRDCALATDCAHDEVQTRRWTQKDGSAAIVGQCQRCGQRRGAAVRVENRAAIQPADLTLIADFAAATKERLRDVAIRHIEVADKKDSEFWVKYNAYLITPAWQRRRQLVLKRCGGICEGCGEAPASQVHHTTYEHVCEEFLFELQGLCFDCHERFHEHTDGGVEPDGPMEFDEPWLGA